MIRFKKTVAFRCFFGHILGVTLYYVQHAAPEQRRADLIESVSLRLGQIIDGIVYGKVHQRAQALRVIAVERLVEQRVQSVL